MSVDFRPLVDLRVPDLFDGRLERFSVHELRKENASSISTSRFLTDGLNSLCVSGRVDGSLQCLTRYGLNDPNYILSCIAEAFATDIVREDQPQYWGFDSQEAWDASEQGTRQEDEDRYYAELLKFLAGESCNIRPGYDMTMAKIAKQLVDQNPELALPANRTRLSAEMDEAYLASADPEQLDWF